MKVLITGAGGQVGRAMTRSAPAPVDCVAASHRELDITKAAEVTAFVETHAPDLIVNAAAWTAVDAAEQEPHGAHCVNAEAAGQLAAAARSVGARMVHLSTDFVFDGTARSPYTPADATNPLSVYGRSKREGELRVLAAAPEHAIVLRTAWVYSAGGNNFLATMLRLMRAAEPVRVVTDQVGTPTTADSIAECIWALARQSSRSGIWHWTDAGRASRFEFASAIAEEALAAGLLSRRPEIVPATSSEFPAPARRPAFSVLDCRETIDATGLRPGHWRTRLREVLGEIAHG